MKKTKVVNSDLHENEGLFNIRKVKKQALNNMHKILSNESEKIKQGFIWMRNGKTAKLVSPEKITLNLELGFKPTI
jgi:hypothetical protein